MYDSDLFVVQLLKYLLKIIAYSYKIYTYHKDKFNK